MAPGKGVGVAESREERVSIAYWRAVVLQREGSNGEALDLLNSSRGEFFSKRLPDFLRAKILLRCPASAHEAAYNYSTLLAKNGGNVPPKLLALVQGDRTKLGGPACEDMPVIFSERCDGNSVRGRIV
jgi:hypothetical protein